MLLASPSTCLYRVWIDNSETPENFPLLSVMPLKWMIMNGLLLSFDNNFIVLFLA